MRMRETRRDLDLPEKAPAADRRRDLRLHDLHRHGTLVLRVAREIHGGHAAAAELPLDVVAIVQGVHEIGSPPERQCTIAG